MIILGKVKRMKEVINDVFKKLASRFLRELRDNYEPHLRISPMEKYFSVRRFNI
jgi:hypothetical protein